MTGLTALANPALRQSPYFLTVRFMLAKMTSKNQLTLPQRIVDAVGKPSHFQISLDGDRLVLTPARLGQADAVRQKLALLGLSEADVTEAVAWARQTQ